MIVAGSFFSENYSEPLRWCYNGQKKISLKNKPRCNTKNKTGKDKSKNLLVFRVGDRGNNIQGFVEKASENFPFVTPIRNKIHLFIEKIMAKTRYNRENIDQKQKNSASTEFLEKNFMNCKISITKFRKKNELETSSTKCRIIVCVKSNKRFTSRIVQE